jgi:biotin synthase
MLNPDIRHDWSTDEVMGLYAQPFNDLLFQAQNLHRRYFDPNRVQLSTLLSIKTGACPEDCAYCPQSIRYDTGLEAQALMPVEEVVSAAQRAKQAGASRF